MNENQSTEFARFEDVQKKLTDAFLKEGYDSSEAQGLSFLVAQQAVRDVPALLRLLDEGESHLSNEIMDAVHAVMSNRFAVNEAARILSLEA